MPLKKPTRYHRVERDAKFHLEDDTGHLWAVSYADFLMVLLSFFILFFSINKKDKDTIIQIISQVRERGLGAGDGAGGLTSQGRAPDSQAADIQTVAAVALKTIPNLKIAVNDKQKTVTFQLNEDIFPLGDVRLSPEGRGELSALLEVLRPFVQDVDVVFVGHTDSKPVRHKRNGVENNFDLSALRAAQAVRLALDMGLPKDSLFTHGSADNTRSTKSLSVVVTEKGAGQI